MAKTINQGDIKAYLARVVKDDVRQLRRELAVQRINLNKAIGVGNMADYINEWEQDFPNSTIMPAQIEPKNKTLRRVTKTKNKTKL
jgi:hypothetical protein